MCTFLLISQSAVCWPLSVSYGVKEIAAVAIIVLYLKEFYTNWKRSERASWPEVVEHVHIFTRAEFITSVCSYLESIILLLRICAHQCAANSTDKCQYNCTGKTLKWECLLPLFLLRWFLTLASWLSKRWIVVLQGHIYSPVTTICWNKGSFQEEKEQHNNETKTSVLSENKNWTL